MRGNVSGYRPITFNFRRLAPKAVIFFFSLVFFFFSQCKCGESQLNVRLSPHVNTTVTTTALLPFLPATVEAFLTNARARGCPVWAASLRRTLATMAAELSNDAPRAAAPAPNGTPHISNPLPKKLHGRAFYESIGSPKFVIAPMVDQSEFVSRPRVGSVRESQTNLPS